MSRKSAAGISSKRKLNEENDPYWEVSNKRRVTIQKFKGKTLVAFREYYEKDGKTLPGKQGISLTVEQFSTLLGALDDIKKTLKDEFGEDVGDEDEEREVAEQDEDKAEADVKAKSATENSKKRKKARLSSPGEL